MSAVLVALLAAVLAEQAAASKRIPQFAGPYIVYADRFEQCEESTATAYAWHFKVRNSHFNPRKPSELQTLTGNVTGLLAVDDSWWTVVKMDTRSNNQWKPNAFIFKFPSSSCSQFRANIPFFFHFFNGPAMPLKGPCIIPVGRYYVRDKPVRWEFPNFPVMPYGHYRFVTHCGVQGNSTPLLCLRIEGHIIPKTS